MNQPIVSHKNVTTPKQTVQPKPVNLLKEKFSNIDSAQLTGEISDQGKQ